MKAADRTRTLSWQGGTIFGGNVKLGRALTRNKITAGFIVAAVLAATSAVASPAHAVGLGTNWPKVVTPVPATNTPDIRDGQVDAVTQVGNLMILGGSFTSAGNHGSTSSVTRSNVLAFDANTGLLSTTFAPTLDNLVKAVYPGPTADTVYVGGSFATVNGVKSKGITLLSTTTGAIVSGFKPPALNGAVYAIAAVGARTYLAGTFTLAGIAAHEGLLTINPTTGALDPFLNVQLAGHHNYNGSTGANGGVGPRSLAINPAGTRAVVIGNFKTADGLPRDQAVMIDLDGAAAAVDPNWATLQFTAACASNAFDTYVTDVQFAADGSYFAITATGGEGTNSDGTKALCDSASRWDSAAQGTNVMPSWIAYTGRDTLWSVAVTGTAIYVGGHQRWLNNTNGHDSPGAGAVPRPGIAALDPASGVPLSWNPGRNPRGAGAYALFASATGLYVGSDTDWIGNYKYKHQKIAYFPLAGGQTLASTATAQLPSNLYEAGPLNASGNTSVNDLAYRAVSGSKIGPLTNVTNTGVLWDSTRGAFMAGDTIFYGDASNNFYRASFDGSQVSIPTLIDPYNDPVWSNVQTGSGQTYRGTKSGYYTEIPNVTGDFYSQGRLYYSQVGKSSLYYRLFSPDSGTVGAQEFTAQTVNGANFSDIAGMVLSGSTLYYADRALGNLHTMSFANATANGSTDTVISGPGLDGNDWRARGLFLYGSASFPNQLPTASATSSCTDLTCSFDASASTDPDGTIASYAWTFGDGTTGTTATPSHAYAKSGTYPVTLTVTDDRGGQSQPWTGSVTVQSTASQVAFVGRAGFNGISASPAVVVPAGVTAGDTELLFVSAGTAGVTTSSPTGLAGWQQITQRTNSPLETTVFRRTATAGDSGTSVSVALAASARVDLEFVDYAGVSSATPTLASAADASTASHVTPTVAVTTGGSWVLSYWSDRTSSSTMWTLPSGVSGRGTGYGTGGGRVDTAIADSGQPVAGGDYGALTASSGAVSGKADMVSIVLAPGA